MLRVISHIPDINGINVNRNDPIKITFNKGIVSSTAIYSAFSVNDAETYATVPGEITVERNISGIADTMVFTPTLNFSPYQRYAVYVYGGASSVLSQDNELLESPYTFTFLTGSGLSDVDSSGSIPSDSGIISSGISSGIYPSTLSILSVYPENGSTNQSIDSIIKIQFNSELNYSGDYSNLSGLINIVQKGVLS